jgi:hypothetical protein
VTWTLAMRSSVQRIWATIDVISRKCLAKAAISNEEVPGSTPGQSCFCLLFGRPVRLLILLVKTVRPDGQNLLLIQCFPGAETQGSRGSYRAAKDPGVSDLTDAGVKSCIRPRGLIFNSASKPV